MKVLKAIARFIAELRQPLFAADTEWLVEVTK